MTLHNLLEQANLTLGSFKQHREASDQALKDAKRQITALNSEVTQLRGQLDSSDRQLVETKEGARREVKVPLENSKIGINL